MVTKQYTIHNILDSRVKKLFPFITSNNALTMSTVTPTMNVTLLSHHTHD